MNRNTPRRLTRWWPVLAAVFIVVLVYGAGAAILYNDASRTAPATAPEPPAGSEEAVHAALLTRGLTELPPDNSPELTTDANHKAKGSAHYLLSPGEKGFTDQENAAVRDYGYFLGGVHPHEDQVWRTYPEPTPGMSLDIDGEFSCTLAFLGHYVAAGGDSATQTGDAETDAERHADPDQRPVTAALTAGHCMESDEDGIIEWSPGTGGYPIVPLGQWDASQALEAYSVEIGDLSEHFAQGDSGDEDSRTAESPRELFPAPNALPGRFDTDWATMSLDRRSDINPRIDGRYEVVTTAGAADLRPGMMVCKMGFRTGETCGPVLSWNSTMVRVNLYSLTGDSGSPAYIKLGGDKVAALGMLSSSPVDSNDVTNDYVTDFALAAPAMRQSGFRLGPG